MLDFEMPGMLCPVWLQSGGRASPFIRPCVIVFFSKAPPLTSSVLLRSGQHFQLPIHLFHPVPQPIFFPLSEGLPRGAWLAQLSHCEKFKPVFLFFLPACFRFPCSTLLCIHFGALHRLWDGTQRKTCFVFREGSELGSSRPHVASAVA